MKIECVRTNCDKVPTVFIIWHEKDKRGFKLPVCDEHSQEEMKRGNDTLVLEYQYRRAV